MRFRKQWFPRRFQGLCLVFGVYVLTIFASPALAQSQIPAPPDPSILVVEAKGARPLASALTRVQELMGVPVSFEEAPHEHPGDLVRTTPASHPGLRPRIIAREGQPLSVTLSPTGVDRRSDAFSAAQSIVAASSAARLPGTYGVVYSGEGVEVAPSRLLRSNGSYRDFTPVMSRTVSVPFGRRSVPETLQALTDSLSRVAGVKIHLLTFPLAPGTMLSYGVTELPARDAIRDILNQARIPTSSYQLLYDPNETAYYLNLLPVASAHPPSTKLPALPAQRATDNPFFVKQ